MVRTRLGSLFLYPFGFITVSWGKEWPPAWLNFPRQWYNPRSGGLWEMPRGIPRGTPVRDPSRPKRSPGEWSTHHVPQSPKRGRGSGSGLGDSPQIGTRSDLVGERPRPVSPQIGTHPTLLGACTPCYRTGDHRAYTTPAPASRHRGPALTAPGGTAVTGPRVPEGQRGGVPCRGSRGCRFTAGSSSAPIL